MPLRSLLTLALLALAFAVPSAVRGETVTQDALLFTIEKHPVDHQGPHVIDLKVRLDYAADIGPKEYPDFEAVYRQLVEWMKTYPNEKDYWEVFNRTLAKKLLAAQPKVAAVTFDLHVHPTFGIQYAHSSVVTVRR